MSSGYRSAFWGLHASILLFGLVGLFGKWILQSPLIIVYGRTTIAAAALLILLLSKKEKILPLNLKHFFLLLLQGILLAIHWLAFFYSIQVSSVAICLITVSAFPVFVTFLEPLFFKEALRRIDVFVAIIVCFGMMLVTPSFDFNNNITQGVLWGIFSGFCFSLLTLLNRHNVGSCKPSLITFYQTAFAMVVLFPFILVDAPSLSVVDFSLIITLGVFCTALSHSLFIHALVHLKAQFASIVFCLEPVYGILLAMFLLGEVPDFRTLIGGIIIIGAIVLATKNRK